MVSDELARSMEEFDFVGLRNNGYNQYSNNFN